MAQVRTRSFSITRPNDTNTYAAGDQIAASSSAPDGAALILSAGDSTGGIHIRSAVLVDAANQATPPDADLLIFKTQPTMSNDNAAFAPDAVKDIPNLLGIIQFRGANKTVLNGASGASGSIAIQSALLGMSIQNPDVRKFFCVLIARNSYIPVANEVFTVNLGVEEVD